MNSDSLVKRLLAEGWKQVNQKAATASSNIRRAMAMSWCRIRDTICRSEPCAAFTGKPAG